MSQSRRTKTLEKKTIHTIVLSFIGIVIVLVVLVMFGMQLLINFSLGIEKFGNNATTNASLNNSTPSYIPPPLLNPITEATNSAQIPVSGVADKNQTVNLYVNGKLIDHTKVKDDKSFDFSNVKLDQGDNDIKAKAIGQDNSQSDYSNDIRVTYTNQAPNLTVDTPQDGQTYGGSPITVSGTTDPNDRVTVNDFWAIIDSNGKFSYSLTLHTGDNDVTVTSVDDAGNKTTKHLKIHLQ